MSMRLKLKIKKGDTVQVVAGDSKGTKAEVMEVINEKNQVIVSGVNIITRHYKPTPMKPEGRIEKREAPINASNVMLLDPKSGTPTKVGIKREGDKKVRVSRKSGEIIK